MLTISPVIFALILAAAWVVIVFGTGGRRNAFDETHWQPLHPKSVPIVNSRIHDPNGKLT